MDNNQIKIDQCDQQQTMPKKRKKLKRIFPVTNNEIVQRLQTENCLCTIDEHDFHEWFLAIISSDVLNDSENCEEFEKLQFLSVLQLILDTCLKRTSKGKICGKVYNLCNTFVGPEKRILSKLNAIGRTSSKYTRFLVAKVVSRVLILSPNSQSLDWLNKTLDDVINNDFRHSNFTSISLHFEILRLVLEWKDFVEHILEDDDIMTDSSLGQVSQNTISTTSMSSIQISGASEIADKSYCLAPVTFCSEDISTTTMSNTAESSSMSSSSLPSTSDCFSFDTSGIKCTVIKCLQHRWLTTDLIPMIRQLLLSGEQPETTLAFLHLWESIISVRANLSVIDTKPFLTNFDHFVLVLSSQNVSALICRQILSLFNEFLCYGSTLALQDLMPDEACSLAHLIVRHVKDFRLLDHLPWKSKKTGLSINTFVGPTLVNEENSQEHVTVDKCLLQKIVLIVLKSVAVVVRETRGDSSDSSASSSVYSGDEQDLHMDMQLIERSIRDVLRKLDQFLKNSLDYHPETKFSNVLVHLFGDQDDYLIESMVCTMDITLGLMRYCTNSHDLVNMLNPVHTFIDFLKSVHSDSNVLLDYLISNETCFLLYLLRFLKFLRRNWFTHFVPSCHSYTDPNGLSSSEFDRTIEVLQHLKMQIKRLVSKNLFPYNIGPILKHLEFCEQLYDGNEVS